jgi:hypothetical protein
MPSPVEVSWRRPPDGMRIPWASTLLGTLPTKPHTTALLRMTPIIISAAHPFGEVTCIRTSSRSGDASLSSAAFRKSGFCSDIRELLSYLPPVTNTEGSNATVSASAP